MTVKQLFYLTTVPSADLVAGADEVFPVDLLLPAGFLEPALALFGRDDLNPDLLQDGRGRRDAWKKVPRQGFVA